MSQEARVGGDATDGPNSSSDAISAADPLAVFRSALVELNRQGKSTTSLSAAARRFGYEPSSRTTMHNVMVSSRLQSEAAVRAYVAAATRNDRTEVERFAKWRNELAGTTDALADTPRADSSAGRPLVRRRPTRRDAVVAGCTAIATAVITTTATTALLEHRSGTEPSSAVSTGSNPLDHGCNEDAVRAGADTSNPVLTVIVVFSPSCDAVWGKVERLDGAGLGDTITVTAYRLDAPHGPETQRVTEHDVAQAFTPMVARGDTRSPICVLGSISVDDGAGTVELVEPQCV